MLQLYYTQFGFNILFLMQGANLTYIQKLPVHESLKTTEIYTHVSRKAIRNIKNPIDVFFK